MNTTVVALFAIAAVASPQALVRIPDKTFEFHSGFWINLDHFLYEQASASPEPAALSPKWTAALDYYRKHFTKRDQLSADAIQLNNRLSEWEAANSLKDSGLDPELVGVLEAAAPIYRDRWWPVHDRANRGWIQADLAPALQIQRRSEAGIGQCLRRSVGPATPIRTDVAEYANWAGAYTSTNPGHITISSTDAGYQGAASLEMLFHEGSHTTFAKVMQTMSSEAKAQNRLYRRRDLWHAVLFYSAGTVVERHLDGYTQYAVKNGLFDRAWPGVAEVLEKDWKPYLNGKIDMPTAIRGLLADYGVDPQPKAAPR